MRILLIWEEIPETVKIYTFLADATMLEWLTLCHHHYIHTENTEKVDKALEKLNRFLETIEPIDDAKPFQTTVCLVILSGFVL